MLGRWVLLSWLSLLVIIATLKADENQRFKKNIGMMNADANYSSRYNSGSRNLSTNHKGRYSASPGYGLISGKVMKSITKYNGAAMNVVATSNYNSREFRGTKGEADAANSPSDKYHGINDTPAEFNSIPRKYSDANNTVAVFNSISGEYGGMSDVVAISKTNPGKYREARDAISALDTSGTYINKASNFLQSVKSWITGDGVNFSKLEGVLTADQVQDLIGLYQDYYECLEVKKATYLKSLSEPMNDIEQILAQAADTLALSCRACMPPLASAESYGVKWQRRLMTEPGFRDLPQDIEKFTLSEDGDLQIQGIEFADAGMYVCLKSGAFEATYLVGLEAESQRVTVSETGDIGPKVPDNVYLPDNNLLVYTQWSDWSVCDQCGTRGNRKRLGLCMRFNKLQPVQPVNYVAFSRFPNGLPCRSTLVPTTVAHLPDLIQRSTFLMIGYCNVSCITPPPVAVFTDSSGNVVEMVDTAKGFHSLRDSPPQPPPIIKLQSVYAYTNSRIVIQCPESIGPVPHGIRWKNGTDLLDAETVEFNTGGRVSIDITNNIIIRRVKLWDNSLYSCWNMNQHLGTVRLKVTDRINWSIQDVVAYVGLAFSAGVMICLTAWLITTQFRQGNVMK